MEVDRVLQSQEATLPRAVEQLGHGFSGHSAPEAREVLQVSGVGRPSAIAAVGQESLEQRLRAIEPCVQFVISMLPGQSSGLAGSRVSCRCHYGCVSGFDSANH